MQIRHLLAALADLPPDMEVKILKRDSKGNPFTEDFSVGRTLINELGECLAHDSDTGEDVILIC